MSLYLEQIRQLVSLQRVDDAIHNVQLELDQAPKELENLQIRFTNANNRRNNLLEKIKLMTEQEKRLNNEIEEEKGRITKSHGKLMQVSNQREYQAIAREIDVLEKNNRTRGEEKSAIIEEKKRQNTLLQDAEKNWKALKQTLEKQSGGLESRLAEAKHQLEKLMQERAVTSNVVPKPVLERYEFIRKRLPHPVIVPVTAGVCSGCRITIPPQTFIELQGGHKILNCPNCQRLIYWSEHFKTEEEKVEKPPVVETEDAPEASEEKEE